MTFHFPFDNSYARLPDRFFRRITPTPVAAPRLVRLNRELARQLRLDPDWLASPQGVEVLAGKRVPEGAEPIATAYAGHQFGQFVPQLGDGRAILLGEVTDRDGVRRDIQPKGSGPTPFSRRGDGRGCDACEEAVGQPGIGVVEGEVEGHDPLALRSVRCRWRGLPAAGAHQLRLQASAPTGRWGADCGALDHRLGAA